MKYFDLPKYSRWTQQAIDCYLSGCNCSNCFIKKYFDKVTTEKYHPHCRMKSTVIALVKHLGKPDLQDMNRILED